MSQLKTEKEKNIMKNKMVLILISILILLFLSILSEKPKPQCISNTTISGNSMLPTLTNNEDITVDKYFTCIKRGDIVIVISLNDSKKQVVKRVIGLPGDIVQFKDKTVYVNGIKLIEPYTKWDKESNDDIKLHTPIKIPVDSYFIMGDNRSVSLDSRSYGSVPRLNIIGKVLKH